jgi:hypothetical protein
MNSVNLSNLHLEVRDRLRNWLIYTIDGNHKFCKRMKYIEEKSVNACECQKNLQKNKIEKHFLTMNEEEMVENYRFYLSHSDSTES